MKNKTIISIVGLVGAIASIIAFFLAFKGTQDNQAVNVNGSNNSVNTNQIIAAIF